MYKEKTKIYIADKEGSCLFSNLCPEEENLSKNCISKNETIFTTIGKARHGKIQNEYGVIYLITYDKDICNHSKLFKKEIFLVTNILPYVSKTRKRAFDDFNHDIPKIHGHNIQEIFSLIPQIEFQKEKTGQDQINFIKKIIKDDPDKVSKTLLKIIKNNSSISNEFTILHSKYVDEYIVQKDWHEIYKVLHNVLINFFADFNDNNVFVSIDSIEDSIFIDFNTFKAALIPFFDNAVKYVLPNSKIKINFENISNNTLVINIEMISLQIMENEVSKIMNEGFIGEMAKKSGQNGKGLGFYKIKGLLKFSDAIIEIQQNTKPEENQTFNDLQYEVNLFKIFVKKSCVI
jgi:hypothetical protein